MKLYSLFCGLLMMAGVPAFAENGEAGQKEQDSFTVLQWNIWQEGTVVPDGYDAIVDEIVRLKPHGTVVGRAWRDVLFFLQ